MGLASLVQPAPLGGGLHVSVSAEGTATVSVAPARDGPLRMTPDDAGRFAVDWQLPALSGSGS